MWQARARGADAGSGLAQTLAARQELLSFEREHGHCNVPQKYSHNPSLGAWVAQQRRRYKHGTLSAKRILLMEQAGVEWSLRRGCLPCPP